MKFKNGGKHEVAIGRKAGKGSVMEFKCVCRKGPTMHRLIFLLLGFIVALTVKGANLSAARYQGCCPRSAPAVATTAEPVSSVGVDDIRKEFNASSQRVRIVALLSPMCGGCQSGHATIAKVLGKFSSPKLRAILVWEPMIEGDSAEAASQQAATLQETRIVQGWNENRSLGTLFGETLDLHAVSWDVYLVYKPGIRWEGERPPQPTFWMHQLNGADPKLLLCQNPTRLSTEVGKLLEQAH